MGITEAEVSCVKEELRRSNYNILKYGGANGTLSGFISLGNSLNSSLRKEHEVMEQYGLPVLQGGSNPSPYAVAAGFALAAILLCAFTGFYGAAAA